MKVEELDVPGVLLITPRVFEDRRGFFLETYQRQRYRDDGMDAAFMQDSHSRSSASVLRGLHYQVGRVQAKLVWVVRGEIFDVAVDLRRDSPTLGRWAGARLSAEDHCQIMLPARSISTKRLSAISLSDISGTVTRRSMRSTVFPFCSRAMSWLMSHPSGAR